MVRDNDDDRDWHLDKRVPIAIIFALFLQLATLIWWGAKIEARVETLEFRSTIDADDHERLVRVEATVESIDDRLARMETRRNGD